MPYPTVTALPEAASKMSGQVNFVNQSALFLQALPTFSFEFNTLLTYINSQYINKYNYGTLAGINPEQPVISHVITPEGMGVPYVSGIDLLYQTLHECSIQSGTFGDVVDIGVASLGTVTLDANAPTITLLTTPQAKTQARDDFNTTAVAYTASVKAALEGLDNRLTYLKDTCFTDEDCGAITDNTIAETVDAGSLTDSVITN